MTVSLVIGQALRANVQPTAATTPPNTLRMRLQNTQQSKTQQQYQLGPKLSVHKAGLNSVGVCVWACVRGWDSFEVRFADQMIAYCLLVLLLALLGDTRHELQKLKIINDAAWRN